MGFSHESVPILNGKIRKIKFLKICFFIANLIVNTSLIMDQKELATPLFPIFCHNITIVLYVFV